MQEIKRNIIPTMLPHLHSITTDKLISFYRHTKERTSSSPSGLHLGYWKAASTNHTLSDILTSIIDIATTNSYELLRWRIVLAILMEKDKGLPLIHRFRTIHLIESDLNFLMRLVWGKELMRWKESHRVINNNQYGGRKGIQAQSAALNKTLFLDVIRYYGIPATIIDKDAQVCSKLYTTEQNIISSTTATF